MISSEGPASGRANGQARRSRVLVTITPYNEQEKRVINPTTAPVAPAAPPPSVAPPPPPPPLPLPSKPRPNEDSVEMQSIESFKLKETPNPVIPKPPPTYFPVNNNNNGTVVNGSPRHSAAVPSKPPECPKPPPMSASPGNERSGASPTNLNGQPPKPLAGKVAVRIGAYEGEVKQPSRLDFLSQQARADKNGTDGTDSGPVVSRLQNELAATLQRSNLRRKTDGESQQPGVKPIPETAAAGNETTNPPEPGKLPQSKVDTLASALNKVTIKVNTDNNSR